MPAPWPEPGAELADVVVAIDGPSGSGKSSVSRDVARALGLRYLDTGAMYRAVTWAVLRAGVPLDDVESVVKVASTVRLEVATDPDEPGVRVDGQDVTAAIRGSAVTAAVSAVSAVPAVREHLVAIQRGFGEAEGGIVVEGRDIGSTVFPQARLKVYLTARDEVRSDRRSTEHQVTGAGSVDPGEVLADLRRRDGLDSNRAVSPLTRAPDAVVVDTSELSQPEVVERVLELIGAAVAAGGPDDGMDA